MIPRSTIRSIQPRTQWKDLLAKARKAIAGKTFVKVDPKLCHAMRGAQKQPREYFAQESMDSLAESIREVGQAVPAFVRKCGSGYEVIEGERRLRIVSSIEGALYEAFLVEIDDDALPYLLACILGGNRVALAALEMSTAIEYLYDELGLPIKEVQTIFGISQAWANKLLSLRHLRSEVRALLDPKITKGKLLPITAAIDLAEKPPAEQLALARRIMGGEIKAQQLKVPAQRQNRARTVASVRSSSQAISVAAKYSTSATSIQAIYARTQYIQKTTEDLHCALLQVSPNGIRTMHTAMKGQMREHVSHAKLFLERCAELLK